MRLAAFALVGLTLCACDTRAAFGASPETAPRPVTVTAEPVAMNPQRPEVLRAGAFSYAGGVWLRAPGETRFGGLSDLRVQPDGRLAAVSDEGGLFRARIVTDAEGRITGLADGSLQPLTDESGKVLKRKSEADAEGLAIWPGGEVMVSFERHHRIWLYPGQGAPPRSMPIPDVSMPSNEGVEGLAVAPSQGPDAYWAGTEVGAIYLCRQAAKCRRWSGLPMPPLAYRLTALSETPTGELVILHHSFNPLNLQSRVLATVVVLPKSRYAVPRVKAQLQINPPMTVDNLEGVSAVRSPSGGLRLYLVSDDNFSDRQRTLLLAYDLDPQRPSRHAR